MGRPRRFPRLVLGFAAFTVANALAALAVRRRATRRADPDADDVALVAIFQPLAFRSRAGAFRGGTLTCWYGGGTLDLRGATLDPGGATLDVRAIFGGGQVVIPAEWRLRVRVIPLLGGVADGRPKLDRPPEAPQLTLRGFTIFGGYAVVSELPESGEQWLATMAEGVPWAPDPSI